MPPVPQEEAVLPIQPLFELPPPPPANAVGDALIEVVAPVPPAAIEPPPLAPAAVAPPPAPE